MIYIYIYIYYIHIYTLYCTETILIQTNLSTGNLRPTKGFFSKNEINILRLPKATQGFFSMKTLSWSLRILGLECVTYFCKKALGT